MDCEKLAFPKGCEMKGFIGKKFLLFLKRKIWDNAPAFYQLTLPWVSPKIKI